MRLRVFDWGVRVLMAHRDGIGVRVVEFLMRPRTRVRGSRYLEPTRELVRVCVLGITRGIRSWCGCRVRSSGRNGCDGKGGEGGALRTIPGFCHTGNNTEVSLAWYICIQGSGKGEEDVRSSSALMSNKLFGEIGGYGILGLLAFLAFSRRTKGG